MSIYRGMDRAALDAAYDNSAAVKDSSKLLADFQARSDRLRAAQGRYLDLRYGPAERNRIDYFAADSPGPVLVFIHGGYRQMRAKENFSFLAAGPLAHGIHAALIGYTLAPEKRLDGIVAEVRAAIAWLAERMAGFGGDPARIYVSGWCGSPATTTSPSSTNWRTPQARSRRWSASSLASEAPESRKIDCGQGRGPGRGLYLRLRVRAARHHNNKSRGSINQLKDGRHGVIGY